MKEVVKDISLLNELVLNPDEFNWGAMTEEEADDHFNNVESALYDEWGDKSMNMIIWIKDLESIKEKEEEDSDDEEDYCDGGCGQKEIWDCSDKHMCKTCDMREEELFTCNVCGEEELSMYDGIDCPECSEFVCDECVISDENDPNCKTDRCVKCDTREEELFTDNYCEWLRLKDIWCGDDETLRQYKKELAGI